MLAAINLSVRQRLLDLSVELSPGRMTAICGPNGAGKSTLLSCLAGLIAADGGAVALDGRPLAALTPQARARQIGYLPQSPELAWDISVETLVSLGRTPWREGLAADREAVDRALATMDLQALRNRPATRLSGGERARALMARVLAGQPRWILADEPLANLDLAHQRSLLEQLAVQANSGVGVVLVLHDLAQAINHADRVLVLDQGALVAQGPPEAALDPATIRRVWGIETQWLGPAGARALSIA